MLLSIPPPASCNDDVKKEDDGDLDLHMIAISQYCADCFDGSCATTTKAMPFMETMTMIMFDSNHS